MSKIDSISRALDTEHAFDLSTGQFINTNDNTAISVIPTVVHQPTVYKDTSKEEDDETAEDDEYISDLSDVKDNLRELISKSMDMADEMFEIVRISETPKAFESASSFLKTIAELNERLLDVHDRKYKRKKIKNESEGILPKSEVTSGQSKVVPTVNNTQNNTIVLNKDPSEVLKALLGKDKP